MYNAGPKAAAAWRALFGRVFADAGLDVRMIEHGWPRPIEALWDEPGLFSAFMCGWPFARSTVGMQAIAAPVPSPARYRSLARYCSDYLVREDSGWTTLEETFGRRFGWMAESSQSGFNAPRADLARHVSPQRSRLFAEAIGPLGNPARTLEALRERRVDVVALDGFYIDLVRHHDPEKLAGLRVVGSTPWTPIPLLVAAPGIDAALVEGLRRQLLGLHEVPAYTPLLADVLLTRFDAPAPGAYAELERLARISLEAGYDAIR
jgi:ABC-type phosphate/phosphonate transport system substrate-binding protein